MAGIIFLTENDVFTCHSCPNHELANKRKEVKPLLCKQ